MMPDMSRVLTAAAILGALTAVTAGAVLFGLSRMAAHITEHAGDDDD